jgi:hypothetical protein
MNNQAGSLFWKRHTGVTRESSRPRGKKMLQVVSAITIVVLQLWLSLPTHAQYCCGLSHHDRCAAAVAVVANARTVLLW